MAKLGDIAAYFEQAVPNEMKMDFDNVGLLVGDSAAEITRAMVALDITLDVIGEAAEAGAQLILSHHPLFFQLRSVTDRTPEGEKAMRLLSGGMAAICLHTSLDCVQGGVNDALLRALGGRGGGILEEEKTLPDGRAYGCGRYGELDKELPMPEFLDRCRSALGTAGLRYYDAGRPVRKLAVCGGSGGSLLADVFRRGCDTYVTADIKYDQFLLARERGLNLIDADHFCTENVVVPVLAGMLSAAFPDIDVRISARHRQTVSFF